MHRVVLTQQRWHSRRDRSTTARGVRTVHTHTSHKAQVPFFSSDGLLCDANCTVGGDVPEGEPGCCDKPSDGSEIKVTIPKDLLEAHEAEEGEGSDEEEEEEEEEGKSEL